MPRVRSNFRQRDVATLLRAVRQSGLHVTTVKVITPDGEIIAETAEERTTVPLPKNPLDRFHENPAGIHQKTTARKKGSRPPRGE